jgi:FkbM family methyltransferase
MHERYPVNGGLAQLIVDQFPTGFMGYGIDVGASDGFSVNTTWVLEKHHRWTILSVEPNPEFHADLVKERAWVEKCACDSKPAESKTFHINLDNHEAYSALRPAMDYIEREQHEGIKTNKWGRIQVKVRTIDQLLEKWAFPRLDLLCIDVEGNEIDVLKGCDLKKWKPEMIILESWDKGTADEYLKQFGYTRVARHVYNDCYLLGVPEDK